MIPDGELVTVPAPPPVSATDSVLVAPFFSKLAVTVVSAASVTWHVPVPVHPPPDQPVKTDPAFAEAVSVICVPTANDSLHLLLLALQLIPAGLLTTWPAPAPASVTVRVAVCAVNIAVTLSAVFIVTVHVPVPLHPAPPQPAKVEPLAGAAVSTTCEPLAKLALHAAPQLIPEGLLVTVPDPLPPTATDNKKLGAVVNVAVTLSPALIVTVQAPVPLHPAPLQPAKVEPLAATAVSTTCEPPAKLALHAVLQLIPEGVVVTVSDPLPPTATDSKKLGAVANVVVTVVSAVGVMMQALVPPQPPPLQPAKIEPEAAEAVRVTCVPTANGAAH